MFVMLKKNVCVNILLKFFKVIIYSCRILRSDIYT